MNISCENQTRKLDNLGRVTIPKGLRDRIGLGVNEEVTFYMIDTPSGYYIGMRPAKLIDPKYAMAIDVLKELGLEVPKELKEKLNEDN